MLFEALLLISLASAAEKPVCDADAITRNCKYFEEKKGAYTITLKDGTSFTNPLGTLPMIPSGPAYSNQGGIKGYNESYGLGQPSSGYNYAFDPNKQMELLADQAEYLEILDDVKIPLKTKLLLSSELLALKQNPEMQFSIPWPLEKPNGSITMKTGKEIVASLKQKLGKQKFAKLESLTKSKAIAAQEQIRMQQEAQNKIAAEQAHIQEESDRKFQEASEKIERRALHLQDLFKSTKKQVIEIFTKGKDESEWSEMERDMVQRIQELKLRTPSSLDIVYDATCSRGKENAYNNLNGAVILCPGLFDRPDANLAFIMGHEIFHSVDPCNFQMPKWKINLDAAQKVFVSGKISKKSADILEKYLVNGQQSVALDLDVIFPDTNEINQLKNAGVFSKIHDGYSLDRYPFKKEYQCFVDKNKFTEVTSADIKLSNAYLQRRLEIENNEQLGQDFLKKYMSIIRKYPQCYRTATHNSQLGEVTSDMMGTLILERYLSDNPPQNEDEKVGAFLTFLNSCKELDSSVQDRFTNFEYLADEHPDKKYRISKINLNLPGMAALFNCKRVEPACFDHLSKYSGTKSSPSTTSTDAAK